MMDMGGMAFGSWAPAATECYQEALRLPPVRLFRAGVEQRDVWAIVRNNIRVSHLVEMDIRSLVAGSQVAHDKMAQLAVVMGAQRFVDAVRLLRQRTEREMRRRISLLEDGEYSLTTWTEWEDELFKVPCRLTIAGDHMHFDFEGAAPQPIISSIPRLTSSAPSSSAMSPMSWLTIFPCPPVCSRQSASIVRKARWSIRDRRRRQPRLISMSR